MNDDSGSAKQPIPPAAKSRWPWVLFWVVAIGLVVLWTIIGVDAHIFGGFVERMKDWVTDSGPWGGLIIIVLMIAHSFLPFPYELIAVAAGAAYGVWWGTFYTWIGAMAGAAVAFYLARTLGHPFVERKLNPSQRQTLHRWSQNRGAVALLISRVIPVISFNLVNYGAGLTDVRWLTFLWTTALGMIPLVVLSVLLGAGLEVLPMPWLIALSVLSVAVILALHMLAKKMGWLHSEPAGIVSSEDEPDLFEDEGAPAQSNTERPADEGN